jgi:hypothetical protein
MGAVGESDMYEDRVLAFIDVLGFKAAINRTISTGTENEDETKKIDNLLEDIQRQIKSKGISFGDTSNNSKIVNQFSDSIIISYLKTEKSGIFFILLEILFLCVSAIQKGFLLRGAIVCGKLCHTKTKIFGPALVKAHEMERNLALYPRIILDEKILKIAENYPREEYKKNMEYEKIEEMIIKDFDGLFYINYLDLAKPNFIDTDGMIPEYLESLRKIIENIEKEEDIRIKQKYLWLKGKYNILLTEYKKRYNNDKAKIKFPNLYEYIKNIGQHMDETQNAPDTILVGRTQTCLALNLVK